MTPHHGAAKDDTSWAGWSRPPRGKLPAWRPSSPTWRARASARPSTSTPRRGRTTSPAPPRSALPTCAPTSRERAGADVVALGEAAGYQGMRWSGIAFTSERDLARWGEPYRPTCAARRWSEPSGTIVHRVLGELGAERRVILWNTVPTHPHRPGVPLSNRRPTAAEVEAGAEFARRLIALVRPATVVAVGRIAESVPARARPTCAIPPTAAAPPSPRGCGLSSSPP